MQDSNGTIFLQIDNVEISTVDHPLLKEEFLATYEEVLAYSNLKLHHQMSFRNVKIYENDHIHENYTISEKNLPHLVYLHGFGGTSLTFIRLFSLLHEEYQIHSLDAFGIGYSSRGNFSENFTYEQARDYYVEAFELWRKQVKIKKFFMVGHSFGGYLATCYAQKYPENIQKLILLSPAGTTDPAHEQEESVGCGRKLFNCLGQKIYNLNIRPTASIKNPVFGEGILERALNGRLKLKDQEKEIWKKYIKQVASQQESSEIGFYKIFDWPLVPKYPIQTIIRRNNFQFQIQFYFGDSDWMNRKGAMRLSQEKKAKLAIVENSGHQLIFDNPEKVAEHLKKGR